uniref:Uncharacterized protein n=1 Tax=Oryza barthii TaxID=65489 RepID=A0A0D3HW40_9ORYZ
MADINWYLKVPFTPYMVPAKGERGGGVKLYLHMERNFVDLIRVLDKALQRKINGSGGEPATLQELRCTPSVFCGHNGAPRVVLSGDNGSIPGVIGSDGGAPGIICNCGGSAPIIVFGDDGSTPRVIASDDDG